LTRQVEAITFITTTSVTFVCTISAR